MIRPYGWLEEISWMEGMRLDGKYGCMGETMAFTEDDKTILGENTPGKQSTGSRSSFLSELLAVYQELLVSTFPCLTWPSNLVTA
jgi:hypothetical protein